MPRFILLEHTGAPDDPTGLHYDLLLEEGEACRTWRLAEVPTVNGAPTEAVAIAPHRLAWLDHREGPVSGNRGHARRVDAGVYQPVEESGMPALAVEQPLLRVRLEGTLLQGLLSIGPTHAVLISGSH
jgi:hypothetical protein